MRREVMCIGKHPDMVAVVDYGNGTGFDVEIECNDDINGLFTIMDRLSYMKAWHLANQIHELLERKKTIPNVNKEE